MGPIDRFASQETGTGEDEIGVSGDMDDHRLKKMHVREKNFLSHAAIYLLARGLPGLVAFLAIPLFSRLLSPADYGRYALIIGAVSLLNALLFQWMRLSLVRYLPAYGEHPAQLKSTLVTVSAALVLALALVGGAVVLLPATRQWWTVIAACLAVLAVQAAFELCCEYSRATIRPWQYMTLQLIRSGVFVGLGVGLVLLSWGWSGPLLGTAAGMGLAAAWAYRRDWRDVRVGIDRQTLWKVSRYGLPLSLTVALTVVIGTSDRFLIAWFGGEDDAGLYSVAFDFTTQTLTLLMVVVHMAMFPLAVQAWEREGPDAAQEQMRSNVSLLLGIGVPCVVGLSVLSPGIAQCFLGESFRDTASQIIPLVALGAFLAGLKAYHFDTAFQFVHRTLDQVWIVLFAAVVNLGLNLVMIPKWGINGAAGASVLSFLMAIGLTAWIGRRHFALAFPVGSCVQVLVASAAMAATLWPLRNFRSSAAVMGQVIAGAAVYGCVLVSFNFIGLRDAMVRKWSRADGPIQAQLAKSS
jgi:O-antigen/teichoic acid export membrane protein